MVRLFLPFEIYSTELSLKTAFRLRDHARSTDLGGDIERHRDLLLRMYLFARRALTRKNATK